ncbi:MAG TPA: hypothetical protein IAC40_04825 [Candidatus Faecivivens stercorigallinarum]|nr:hypothetical protein [Candidatus Faecivivens stercorigallinarum]
MTGKKVLKIFLKILIGIFLVLGCLCWFYAIYVELSGATTGGFIDLSNLFVWGALAVGAVFALLALVLYLIDRKLNK